MIITLIKYIDTEIPDPPTGFYWNSDNYLCKEDNDKKIAFLELSKNDYFYVRFMHNGENKYSLFENRIEAINWLYKLLNDVC